MRKLKLIVMLVCMLAVLVILLQNSDSVETRILFATFVMPRAVLLFVTFSIGFVIGGLTMSWLGRSRRDPTVT